ncbi:hypothetical protein FOZ63_019207, partial [Perkinsus olseni]
NFTAAEDAPALCELWRPSFDWLADEMIYTYPIGDEVSQSATSSSGSAIPYDEVKKKIKCVVGDPPSPDHFFTGASSDNYLQWRVTILETLADADEAPNRLLPEVVISCLKGSIRAFIKRQVSRQNMLDDGAMAVIAVSKGY